MREVVGRSLEPIVRFHLFFGPRSSSWCFVVSKCFLTRVRAFMRASTGPTPITFITLGVIPSMNTGHSQSLGWLLLFSGRGRPIIIRVR